MRDMTPIELWWFTLDFPTRMLLQAGPTLPLTADLAARIHEAGGVLDASHLLTGEEPANYHVLPDDIAWIRTLKDTRP